MQIKRYEAPSMRDAVKQIRADLGPDAIVLSTKELQGKVEVFAARDEHSVAIERRDALQSDVLTFFKREMDQLKRLIRDVGAGRDVWAELRGLKEMINDCLDVSGMQHRENVSSQLSQAYYRLVAGGIERKRALHLLEGLKGDSSAGELKTTHDALVLVEGLIRDSIAASFDAVTEEKTGDSSFPGRIVAFVGPAGSGKTTTLAKLAASYLLEEGLDIAVVTTDTFRIGAAEQLKIYARIMDVPMRVVSKKEEFTSALEQFADRDVILVDTPGKSRNDEAYLRRLKDYFDGGPPVEANLVLSVTDRLENMLDAASRFGITDYDNMIFTKLDDADGFGSIYNCIEHVGKPVRYIANGQNVPRDLRKMDPEKLARLIVENRVH